MYDLAVIGGGPAGLTAIVYAARKNLDVVLITGDIGGQVNKTMGVENYMGYQFVTGPELMAKFEEQVSRFPIKQVIGEKTTRIGRISEGFETVLANGERYESRAVIYAAGKRSRPLNIPGESDFVGRGVSYCAICDGPVFSGQRVAIVGGGNSAVSAALDMAKVASHVDLVSVTSLTGDAVLVEKLDAGPGLNIYTEHRPERILGDGFVRGFDITDMKSGEHKHLDVEGVFVEIGLIPNSDAVRELVKLNERGEVPVNCSCETGVPGLYAAGDVTDVPEKQIVVAAGEGAKAALQAHRYLQRLPK